MAKKPAKKPAKPAKAKPSKKEPAKKASASSGKKPEKFTPKPQPSSLPTSNDIVRLADRCISFGKQQQSLSGEQGELIRNAIETKNLDRKAFSIVKGLYTMDPVKLATTLAHFDHYREALKLDNVAKKQGNLGFSRSELAPGNKDGTPKGSKPKEEKAAKPAEAEATNGTSGEPTEELNNVTTLVHPNKLPSQSEVDRIADRAEASTH